MKSKFSTSWRRSRQPRKQRKYRANAPLHLRRHMISAHLSKALRRHGRSAPLRKGDEVIVMRGNYKKTRGKVERINASRLKVYVDSVKKKRVSGQEVLVALDPSNLLITKLNMDDAKRKKSMRKRGTKVSDSKEEKTGSSEKK